MFYPDLSNIGKCKANRCNMQIVNYRMLRKLRKLRKYVLNFLKILRILIKYIFHNGLAYLYELDLL